MIRRDFMSSASKAALIGLVPGVFSCAQNISSGGPVDTPEKRALYLKTMLNRLCTDIGIRQTGSPEFARSAAILRDDLRTTIPMTEFDSYPFVKWELSGKPEFYIGGKSIETASSTPRPGGDRVPTPPEGISGIIKNAGNGSNDGRISGYVVADPVTGEPLLNISVNLNGRAIPAAPRMNRLGFGIGIKDLPLIEAAAANKTPVRAVAHAVPENATGINVVATIPGETNKEILFLAHSDTVYQSPGANDNTASVLIMLMIAHTFSGTKPKYTLRFVPTDAEEYGLMGANHYADLRKKEGTFNDIAYILTFDSLTWGPDLEFVTEDSGLTEILKSVCDDLNIPGNPRFIDRSGFTNDATPFRDSGARAVYGNSRGDDATWSVYHRPEDTVDTVNEKWAENAYLVYTEFVWRLMNE
ncbi:M28 family metallopeptidase [Candidatus Latescibacterota bacterium]